MPAKSFISYAREDTEFALKLAADLRQAGVNIWVDRFDIPVGQNWPRAVEEALDSCGQFLVVLSPVSVRSENVMAELNFALDEGKRIFPVLCQECKRPFRVRSAQYADFTGGYQTALSELLKALGREHATGLAAEDTPVTIKSVAPVGEGIEYTVDPQPVRVSPHPERPRDTHSAEASEESAPLRRDRSQPAFKDRDRRVLYSFVVLLALTIGIGYFVKKVIVGSGQPAQPRTQADSTPRTTPPAAAPTIPAGTAKVNAKDRLTYIWIPAGTFQMGCSPKDSECAVAEKPPHQVTITKGFWMGQTEVTQEAYQQVMGTNPSNFKGARLPVENITWNDATSYCQKADMRLPTEAEWEYAARAGSSGRRYGNLDEIVWYSANSEGKTHEVAGKQANAWGLRDMLGNVWEWVADRFVDEYPPGNETDPPGPPSGTSRTVRGGAWNRISRYTRLSTRGGLEPASHDNFVGFRCGGN